MTAFLVTAVQTSAFAAYKDLQVVNHTGFDIKGLYITTTGEDNWGSNLLNETLQNGGSSTIWYDDNFRYFDLKIVFMDDSYRTWTGDRRRDFKNAWRMTIYKSSQTEKDGSMIFTVSYN